ncbi:MAG: ATP-binding cassette domain-containing protein, partial [Candidatus Omnitrophica bacterium]|nr:ATP-binding cassette domain-containing protein [Candidatus Omnitrophota bacterium]
MDANIKIMVRNLNFYYGDFQALKDINLDIRSKMITAIIGPSGCGKTTLLRCFNRMNDLAENTKLRGEVLIDGKNIYENSFDLLSLRKKVGMVFQRPNPFALSIYENIAFGLKIHHLVNKKDIPKIVEESLLSVHLWDSV